MNKETGWVIAYSGGIYTGWWITRRDAIATHVHELFDTRHPYHTGPLDAAQKAAWRKCRESGDRAVRAVIKTVE